jgi:tetratricopeptide (TPR) repeat protein
LVEGSVLRVGNRVRINAQLIRGANDEHLWAEDYDRDLQDILNLLSEVARAIAGEIQVALTPQQQERLTAERKIDPDVYEIYLRGLHHLHKFTLKDALESRRFFEQAIAADPNFAPAHAGLGGINVVYCLLGGEPAQDLLASAREAALRALEIDPNLAAVHVVLGFVELYANWDWATAEREFQQALALDPTNGDALHGLSTVQIIYGRYDESVDLVLRARKYDPYSYLRNLPIWSSLMFARKYEQVVTEIEGWRAFSGDTRAGWYYLFDAYCGLGRDEEAMIELRSSTTGSDPEVAPVMEKAYADHGIPGASQVCAEYLVDLSRQVNRISIAAYFARAGDEDQTFVWLEKAYEERMRTIFFIEQPVFDPYREDPRFVDLRRRIGFPELNGD